MQSPRETWYDLIMSRQENNSFLIKKLQEALDRRGGIELPLGEVPVMLSRSTVKACLLHLFSIIPSAEIEENDESVARETADFQERVIETSERQAARGQCDEGLEEYYHEKENADH